MQERKKEIGAYGKAAKGRTELIRHLEGRALPRGQAILAKCYECMGFFADGKVDCLMPACPLYAYMPYRDRMGSEQDHVVNQVDEAA